MIGTFGLMVMQEPTFFILTALAERSLHGYGIMQSVGELSDGRITLRAGTLYAALERLTGDGLLTIEREEAVEGRLRRYYRLTDHGGAELAAEVERMRTNAAMAAARLRRGVGDTATGLAGFTLGADGLGADGLGADGLGAGHV